MCIIMALPPTYVLVSDEEEEEQEEGDVGGEGEEEATLDLPQVVPFSSADEESITGRVAPAASDQTLTPARV